MLAKSFVKLCAWKRAVRPMESFAGKLKEYDCSPVGRLGY